MKPSPLFFLLLLLATTLPCFLALRADGDTPITPDECGKDFENHTCTVTGACCSTYGHCGFTDGYCAPGNCQEGFGVCWDYAPPPPPTPSPPPPPPYTPDECGKDFYNHSCTSIGACCSNYGHCGFTDDFCAPENCQVGFGECWDHAPPPPALSLDSDEAGEEHVFIRKVFDKLQIVDGF